MAKSLYGSLKKERSIRFQKRAKKDKRTGVRDNPTWLEKRSCVAKRRYTAQHAAIAAARGIYSYNPEAPDLFIYDCIHCDGWHMTSTKSRDKNNTQIAVRRLPATETEPA